MLLKFQPNFIKFPRNSIYAAVSLRIHRVLCETCSFKELFHSLPIVGLLTKDKEIGNVSIKRFTIESESKHALLQHHWNHNFFSTSQYRWPWLIPKNFQSVDFVDFGRNFPSAGGFVSLSQSPLQRHSSSYSTSSSQSQLIINYILLWCVLFHPDSNSHIFPDFEPNWSFSVPAWCCVHKGGMEEELMMKMTFIL